MSSSERTIPWIRIAADGGAIIVSILLALSSSEAALSALKRFVDVIDEVEGGRS